MDIAQTELNEVRTTIARLPGLHKKELLGLWARTFPAPPPPKLRKELIVPILAYRMQEAVHGGLSNTARRRLHSLLSKQTPTLVSNGRAEPPAPSRAKLVRSWRGEIHEVFVVESGYRYRGETYKKLSPIAKRITGTQWSGPAFFGTRGGR